MTGISLILFCVISSYSSKSEEQDSNLTPMNHISKLWTYSNVTLYCILLYPCSPIQEVRLLWAELSQCDLKPHSMVLVHKWNAAESIQYSWICHLFLTQYVTPHFISNPLKIPQGLGAREPPQLIKCLPRKQEDLRLIPRIHVRMCGLVVIALGKMEAEGCLGLAG